MRIVILADPLDNQNAGVHIFTREFIHALVKYDTENEYILIREKRDENLPLEQIEVPNVHLPIGLASIRLFFIIPLIIRRLKPDVVLEPAHFGPFNLPKRIKRITVIHDLTPIIFPQFHRKHSQILQKIFLGRILRNADMVLTNSEHTSRDVEKYYPVTKGKIVSGLLGKEELYQPTNSRQYLEQKELNSPYFLFVGTIEPRKNLLILLEAFADYKKTDNEDTKLILVGGNGWKSESFLEALNKHPNRTDIIRPGYVEKKYLPELYSHCKAFIYPSLYEGFGLPILEAMACGAIVITSDVSSMPEVGGEAAFYINPSLSSSLLTQMEVVSNLSPAEIVDRKSNSIEQASQFSWEEFAMNFKRNVERLFQN